jgi:hypothetical protein
MMQEGDGIVAFLAQASCELQQRQPVLRSEEFSGMIELRFVEAVDRIDDRTEVKDCCALRRAHHVDGGRWIGRPQGL